ncbi:MAG: DUF3754 domain-containing protein [Planctomycetaceae bacterium]|nr:DUF3754 domain-containing protein [Planctomycetaceae bacterium]
MQSADAPNQSADKLETFIPFRRQDIIEMCLAENRLSAEDTQRFREFANILSALQHFEMQGELEHLKSCYAPFTPDAIERATTQSADWKSPTEAKAKELSDAFRSMLQRMSYTELSDEDIDRALKEETWVHVSTDVNLEDFEELIVCYRGRSTQKIKTKKWYVFDSEVDVPVYHRVAILVRFKNEEYFKNRRSNTSALQVASMNFTPGKAYIFHYKDIPQMDLELLFPNVVIGMNWFDKLVVGVPAAAAVLGAFAKLAPQMMVIAGALLFYTLGRDSALAWTGTKESDVNDIMPVLAATFAIATVLGTLLFNQYYAVIFKQLQFQKTVTDTLFFRNLENNRGALCAFTDLAEEEETKEMLLAYYFLLTRGDQTATELDQAIEGWLGSQGATIDFDVSSALTQLEGFAGRQTSKPQRLNVVRTSDDTWSARPIPEAFKLLDDLWDNAYT